MTSTAPTEAPASTDLDELVHLFCTCSPEWSICGQDVTDDEVIEGEDSPDDCIVCVDLSALGCPRCGAP